MSGAREGRRRRRRGQNLEVTGEGGRVKVFGYSGTGMGDASVVG